MVDPHLKGEAGGAAAPQAMDGEAAVAGLFRPDRLESQTRQPAPPQGAAEAAEHGSLAGRRQSQEAARPQDACRLGGGGIDVKCGQQVELVVWKGERVRVALLEGNPPLRVESDASSSGANRLLGTIDAADAGARELTGEEERCLTVATFDLQNPLGIADVEHRGGKRSQQGRGGHLSDRRCTRVRKNSASSSLFTDSPSVTVH